MEEMMKILVTGGTGFVGKALTRALLDANLKVRITGQTRDPELEALGAEWFPMADLSNDVDWCPILENIDAVVHLAAIAHRFESSVTSDRDLYNRVNHLATKALAEAAVGSGRVKRFLFLSSIRVHGDPIRMPINEDSPIAPITFYDQSKVDAEDAVNIAMQDTAVTWAIMRPVLVYGSGNRGNMARLEGLLRSGVPVPLPSKPNARSFVFVGNLVSAMQSFLLSGNAPSGRRWIVSDGEPASIETLLKLMSSAMGLRLRAVHLPNLVLRSSAKVGDLLRYFGVSFPWNTETRRKLTDDLYVDIGAICRELRWLPPFTLAEGIDITYKSPETL